MRSCTDAERDVEAPAVGAAGADERDQEVDEVYPRPTGGEQRAEAAAHRVTETQPRLGAHPTT